MLHWFSLQRDSDAAGTPIPACLPRYQGNCAKGLGYFLGYLILIFEICIILYATLKISRVVMTHIYEYECVGVGVCTASRQTEECNCCVGSAVRKMARQREC